MRTARRALVIAGLVLAGVLVIALLAAGWILGTESGLRFALARVAGYLPDGLEIGAVEGRAAGPLVARDVRFETDRFTVRLDRLELEWRLAALPGSEIVVERLHADGLRVALHEAPPEPGPAEPFSMPERIDLPVDVFVADARVRDISILAAGGGDPLVVDAVRLAAEWTDRALALESLEIDAPLGKVRATAEAVPRGEYPLSGELEFTLRPPGFAPISGDTRLAGSLEELTLEQALAAPYNSSAEVTLRDVVRDLSFESSIDIDGADFARIAAGWPAATASARIRAEGDLSAVQVSLTARGIAPAAGELEAAFEGEVSPERIAVERLVVDLPDTAAHLEAAGEVNLAAAAPDVNLDAQWKGLQWPLRGAAQIASESGRVDVTGTLDDYRARLDAALSVPNQTSGRVRLAGRGDTARFTADTIDVDTLGGQLNGTASVAWSPVLAGRVDLRGSGLDPGGLIDGWPGRIDLVVTAEGRMPETGPEARVQVLQAEGRLRGQPLNLDARGTFGDGTVNLDAFNLRSGSTELQAGGRLGEELALDWSVTSDDLGSLLPEARGALEGDGRVSGTPAEPALTAELTGTNLAYADYEAASLALDADVDAGGGRSRLDLELRDGRAAGIEVESVTLAGRGTRTDHSLLLDASTSAGRLELGIAEGSLDPQLAWSFVVDRLDYAHPDLSPWSLRSPAPGRLSSQAARIENLCLESSDALLCLEGRRTPARLAAGFELRDLPLALANPFLPEALRIEGTVGGAGRIDKPAEGTPVARVDLETAPIRLLAENEAGEMQEMLAFAAGDIALDLDGADGLRLSVDLPLEAGGGLGANATIAAGSRPLTERALDARLRASLPEIGFLTEFTPQIEDVSGRLEGDFRVAGSLAAPRLDGSLDLLEGSAMLPGPQIRLRDVTAAVRGRGAGDLEIDASARAGNGTLKIDGRVGVGDAGPQGRLEITGEDFRAFNTPEARVHVSPDLTVALDGNRLDVTGTVRVPLARIRLTEAPASAVGVSDDQVIVMPGAEETGEAAGMRLSAEVRVLLGEAVTFEGFGLTADLAGDMTVVERPGEPTTATGEISVEEGRYEAYGQNLEIQRGRVLFVGGPIDRPGINVRAVRRPAEDVLVGVEARGSLRQPQFTVFSEPPMSESEQLSYLVLGRPLEGGPASENSALARAALALGIKGGNFLTEQFGGKLGVDEIGIETEPGQTNEQAALVLGKYLSPKLYVSYGVGLLEPVSTLKLRYALSSKWRLVTESSSVQSGGDLLYTIER